jgi:hypothetical protein
MCTGCQQLWRQTIPGNPALELIGDCRCQQRTVPVVELDAIDDQPLDV